MFYEIGGGITAPKGFQATGIHCGIKRMNKDLSLVVSEEPATAAGVFTTNKVVAAPVIIDQKQLERSDSFRAILVNSGNANACTGEKGYEDGLTMVRTAAAALSIEENEVLISSTGVIGQYLPMGKLIPGITEAASMLDVDGHTAAAEAIMTTDKFSKELAIACSVNGTPVKLGGMAKGSGMIAPNMATMLAFITTDAKISSALLHKSLKNASDRSFNRISVDGDMSTNDMVLILANGTGGNAELQSELDAGYEEFYNALEHLLVRLSKMIVMDGEGATKFIEIEVMSACSERSAVQAAKTIANSNLVKTAIHGEDANWGRIICAIGYSGIDFNPADVEIFFGDIPILKKNYKIDFSEQDAKKVLAQKEIKIRVGLNQGKASASFWTCDLSKEYIAINANYRT
jgi:glutamate N-acetyltransferase/amino-acid N-acetyltransferase